TTALQLAATKSPAGATVGVPRFPPSTAATRSALAGPAAKTSTASPSSDVLRRGAGRHLPCNTVSLGRRRNLVTGLSPGTASRRRTHRESEGAGPGARSEQRAPRLRDARDRARARIPRPVAQADSVGSEAR